jgi:hypothetical protein
MFSFGYWGWGSSVKQLVESIDVVEAARGFQPPLFVDIRVSRSVRAAGFDGAAFERAVGSSRYRWLDSLGNTGILDGGTMRIKDPTAANVLLDIAVECARDGRRLLFFCACEVPCNCHRAVVAELTLEAAAQRKLHIEVVEWPGGEPELDGIEVELPLPEFEKVRHGAKSIPLGDQLPLTRAASVPWYSLVAVRREGAKEAPSWRLMTGPARYKKAGWYLPVYGVFDGDPREAIRAMIQEDREADGYSLRRR